MEVKKVSKQNRNIVGEITLTGSKSICNRALIIRAFSKKDYPIHRIAAAKDTQTLIELLNNESDVYDAGPAGTTFRFMTAYLAMQDGNASFDRFGTHETTSNWCFGRSIEKCWCKY